MQRKIDIVTIIMLVVAFFTIILQIFPPKTPKDQINSVIYFLAILGYASFLYGANWTSKKIKSYIDQINDNKKEIQKIKFKMNLERKFNEIDKRLFVLESLKKTKKGQINIEPKWIFLAVLLLLFYLYLRSLGLV